MPLRGGGDSPSTINSFPVRHCPSVLPRPCLVYSSSMLRLAPSILGLLRQSKKMLPTFLKGLGLTITHYLGVSLTGRAFRSNLFLDKKGFPLQYLTRASLEAYGKRQNGKALNRKFLGL